MDTRSPARARHRIVPVAILFLAALLVPAGQTNPEPHRDFTGLVVRLVDGDTIHVTIDGRTEKVRYIGINCPEVHHPRRGEESGGREATEINRTLVGGKSVRLEPDVQLRDRYGRLLAYVWVRQVNGTEIMVNAELVRRGYAQVMTIPPNVRHAATFRRLQAEAREAHRGLWGTRALAPGGPAGRVAYTAAP